MSFAESRRILAHVAQQTDAVLVMLSGGKDSLVTVDLCLSVFKRVEGLYMYPIAGLRSCDGPVDIAEKRFGIKVHRTQHWLTNQWLREGMFRPSPIDLPKIGLNDIQNIARAETGIQWIASGERAEDSMARRARLVRCKGLEEPQYRMFPIYDWHTTEVVSYLRAKRIPLPPRIGSSGQSGTSGFELRAPCLRFLRDNYPDDYQKVLEVFPHAESAIKREEFSRTKEDEATAI